jgi:hypothetical protein
LFELIDLDQRAFLFDDNEVRDQNGLVLEVNGGIIYPGLLEPCCPFDPKGLML